MMNTYLQVVQWTKQKTPLQLHSQMIVKIFIHHCILYAIYISYDPTQERIRCIYFYSSVIQVSLDMSEYPEARRKY